MLNTQHLFTILNIYQIDKPHDSIVEYLTYKLDAGDLRLIQHNSSIFYHSLCYHSKHADSAYSC